MKYLILLTVLLGGCHLIEPTDEGYIARQEVAGIIKEVIPAPWGLIGGAAFSLITGGIAAVKARQATTSRKVAEAVVSAVEASGDDKVKKAAMKASRYMGVPQELDKIALEIEKKGNGHA